METPNRALKFPYRAPESAFQLIRRARVFSQQMALEWPKQSPLDLFLLAVRHLPHLESVTLTIRYTDNWYWQDSLWGPCVRSERWVDALVMPDRLREFALEWETLASKEAALRELMRDLAARWTLRKSDEVEMRCDGVLDSYMWTGTARFDGTEYYHQENGHMRQYCVVKATWRPLSEPADARETEPV